MKYVLSDECARATEVVKDICNNVDEYGLTRHYVYHGTHPSREIINIHSLTNSTLIVAESHEVFATVYAVIESINAMPKIDEYITLDVTQQIVASLQSKTVLNAVTAFLHHCKRNSKFDGTTIFQM
jgi:hypothetical protein